MKTLLALSMVAAASTASAETPQVSECFKVNALLKTDAIHYWADWTSHCPFTIDSVYVMVRFTGKSERSLDYGVWPMYFVKPGAHRVVRFSIPAGAVGFESVKVRKITTNSMEALRPQEAAIASVHGPSWQIADAGPALAPQDVVREVTHTQSWQIGEQGSAPQPQEPVEAAPVQFRLIGDPGPALPLPRQ